MPADPEQELDGNVMPLSVWLAATTKHENWRHTWDLPREEKAYFLHYAECSISSTAGPDVVPDITLHL